MWAVTEPTKAHAPQTAPNIANPISGHREEVVAGGGCVWARLVGGRGPLMVVLK